MYMVQQIHYMACYGINNKNKANFCSPHVHQARTYADTQCQKCILMKDNEIKERWGQYFNLLMTPESWNRRKRPQPSNDTVSKEETETSLKGMKSGKAVGADEIPAEAWKCIGNFGIKIQQQKQGQLLQPTCRHSLHGLLRYQQQKQGQLHLHAHM